MRQPLFRAPLPLLSLLVCGCAAQTEPLRMDEIVPVLPANFVGASGDQQAEPVDEWWTRFGDPQLDAYVARAIADNPSVLRAVARAEQARAAARIAQSELYPQVVGRFEASRGEQNTATLGLGDALGDALPSSITSDRFTRTVNVSWEVDLWGRIGAQNNAARADFLASAENLRATRQSIAAQVSSAYFNVINARQQVAVSEDLVSAIAEITRQVGNRADAGIASPNDKALAIANLGQARAALAQRREALRRAELGFGQLIRAYPDGEVAAAQSSPPLPPLPAAGLPASLIERRPDIRAAEFSLQAAGYRLAAAQRSRLPAISLTGAKGNSTNDIGSLFDPVSAIWNIAGSIVRPIFQGGRYRAQVDQADGARDEAIETYAEIALRALTEVETALAVEDLLAQRQAALGGAAIAARQSVDVSFNRYRSGLEPFVTVLESQQRALEAGAAHLDATNARIENRIALHLALGGGFEDAPVSIEKDQ